MRRTPFAFLMSALVFAGVSSQALGQPAEDPPATRALGALADFGLAYSYWTVETRCQTLDEPARTAFQTLIGENVEALSAVFPPETVSSVASAGAQMANEPDNQSCADARGDVRFGNALARGVLATTKGLPKGFKAQAPR